MNNRIYQVRPAIYAPVVLLIVCLFVAFQWSWWALLAIPFICLGSIGATPNLNLVNGCFAYLSIALGFGLFAIHRPSGAAILAGAMFGFYTSAVEKWIRMKPVPAPGRHDS